MDSEELAAAGLPRTRFRDGFAIDEVDEFIDQCVAALRACEQGRRASLSADAIVAKRFRHVRFAEAYDPDAVDDLLDRVVAQLREHQPQPDGAIPQPHPPSPEDVARSRRSILLVQVFGVLAVVAGVVIVVMKALGRA